MRLKGIRHFCSLLLFISLATSCKRPVDEAKFANDVAALELNGGEVALCGAGPEDFGTVAFSTGCSESVAGDFNLATALLHSFEYVEAEKVYARIIEKDPECAMAYWGIAMCNFHPLWAPPGAKELQKGERVIALARSVAGDKTSRESAFIEAIAVIYDDWDSLDHKTRLRRFAEASEKLYEKYPDDVEVAIFYALALDASADPADKTFRNQLKAGMILNKVYGSFPNHPGIAHYIIHNYDYPELAHLGLAAARKYASIAAASAHAQHMPSHIFTRLGLWDESIQSNLNSVSAAQCYAEKAGIQGHWDEELHGLDYLIYAYLQKANDMEAKQHLDYLNNINNVSPVNFKVAYSFAAGIARYAVERKNWEEAAKLELLPREFPWDDFPWESANVYFARFLGAIRTGDNAAARRDFEKLLQIHEKLLQQKDHYKANLVHIQLKACEAWTKWAEGNNTEAIALLRDAATMEEATAKHPVTPGEIIPARELLADLYFEIGDMENARKEYEADLQKHPNKFNGLYGAARAAERLGDRKDAADRYRKLLSTVHANASDRPQVLAARKYLGI